MIFDTHAHLDDRAFDTDRAALLSQLPGLGLALVKKGLEIVGGEISVRSSPGEGSAFTVVLETDAASAHIS